jgi:hypothetical protein
MNPKLDILRSTIQELGGQDANPVLALELFFDGNHDVYSIGPNLEPHPGLETFYRVLREIRERPDVADVVLEVVEVMQGDDEWPFVDTAYVITTAETERVHEWASALEPDPPEEGWLRHSPPPGAPGVPEGHHIVALWWD